MSAPITVSCNTSPVNTAEISSFVTNTRKSPSSKITPSTAGSAAPKLLIVLKNESINVIGALVSFYPNFMASLPRSSYNFLS